MPTPSFRRFALRAAVLRGMLARAGWLGASRRRDCHFDDAPFLSLLKDLINLEGVQQIDSLTDGYRASKVPMFGMKLARSAYNHSHGRRTIFSLPFTAVLLSPQDTRRRRGTCPGHH